MPELPEVETIKRQLGQDLIGQKIKMIKVLSPKNFIGEVEKVVGKKIIGVERRAKVILVKLEGDCCLLIHLKLTGQLIYLPVRQTQSSSVDKRINLDGKQSGPFVVGQLPNNFTRIIITFDSGHLFFNDLRKFGWVKVVENCQEESQKEFKNFGPEALGQDFSLAYFKQVLSKSRRAIKLVLLDQKKLAGVGNIYANEALFMAKIDPRRPANSLSDLEIKKLRLATRDVLAQAIKKGGTTANDDAYRQANGKVGTFQKYLQVYGRTGQSCPNCSGQIERIKLGGRGTFFCSQCQK